jgi:alanyl-tRNA synthetase
LQEAAERLGCAPDEVPTRVESLLHALRETERELAAARHRRTQSEFESLLGEVQQVDGVSVLATVISTSDRATLRQLSDWFREQVLSGAIVVGANIEGQAALLAAVTDDLVDQGLRADWLIREVAGIVGGGGGGRAVLAEGGGGDTALLSEAIARVPSLVAGRLSSDAR